MKRNLQCLLAAMGLLLLLSLPARTTLAQCNAWEKYLGYDNAYIQDADRDRFGNLYATGYFYNDGQHPIVVQGTTLQGYGMFTGFLLKFNKNNVLVWAKTFGDGTDYAAPHEVAVDHDDQVVIAGIFNQSMAIGCTTLNTGWSFDTFVAKFAGSGDLVWAIQSGATTVEDYDSDLAISPANDIIVTGSFVAGGMQFNGVPLTSYGGYDSYVVRLAPEGSVKSALSIGGGASI